MIRPAPTSLPPSALDGGPSARGTARRSRPGRRLALVAAILGLILIAAACGGGSNTTTAGATATTGGDQQSSRQAYTDCLKQNGVTLPARGQGNGQGDQGSGQGGGQGGGPGNGGPGTFDPNAGPGTRGSLPPGVDQATMDKARAACQSLRPTGGFGGGGGGGGTAFQAYASCMKDHGVTLPARGNASTDTSSPPSTIDRTSAAFQTANDACKALLPAQGQGGQGDSSTSTTTAP